MQNYLIKTKHLGIRYINEQDLHYLKALDKDPIVKKFFPSGTLTSGEITKILANCEKNRLEKNLPCFAVFTLKQNVFVGRAYFDQFEDTEIKVAYLLHKKFWHQGYATEILRALLAWAKQHIKAEYIIAYADKKNTASLRVMQKCGMQYYKDGTYQGMKSHCYRIKNIPVKI